MTKKRRRFSHIILAIVVLLIMWQAVLLARSGERSLGPIENIDGIPFPATGRTFVVTEKLAHADMYLEESVLAKQLRLTVTFTPLELERLEVGVRENGFWLSYPKVTLYDSARESDGAPEGERTVAVIVPLTDKLQEPDQSIDLMFFAATADSTPSEDEGIDDTTSWLLHNITARVQPTVPTTAQLKDFARALLTREKAL